MKIRVEKITDKEKNIKKVMQRGEIGFLVSS